MISYRRELACASSRVRVTALGAFVDQCIIPAYKESWRFGRVFITEADLTHRVVINPGRQYISAILVICSDAIRTLANLHVRLYVYLRGETWLLSLMLQSCSTPVIQALLRKALVVVTRLSIEICVNIFLKYPTYCLHRESARPVTIMGERAIAFRDSLAFRPWHLTANLDVKAHSTSVIEHLRHRKG